MEIIIKSMNERSDSPQRATALEFDRLLKQRESTVSAERFSFNQPNPGNKSPAPGDRSDKAAIQELFA